MIDQEQGISGKSSPSTRNVNTIARLEKEALHHRTATDRLGDRIAYFAGSGPFIVIHVFWFTVWVILNSRWFSKIPPFDPFPFTFLTMIVSLEAIFLTAFVLMSQNRLTRQAEKRAHLDLQINVLTEQELTMALRMLERLCVKAGVEPEDSHLFSELFKETDLLKLMKELEKNLPDPK